MPKKPILTPRERSDRLQNAMATLIGNEAFGAFIDELREQQRAAMLDSMSDKVIASDRLSMAAVGEMRAYEGVISMYDDFVQTKLAQADAEAELRGN